MTDHPTGWFDKPRNVTLFLRVVYVICGLALLLELLIHKHGVPRFEGWFSFYPVYGFVGIVVLVLLAILLRKLVMRPEDYYDA
ncbi:MAG: hypothetical protein V2A76_06645 [Planctomycetota bacterium]